MFKTEHQIAIETFIKGIESTNFESIEDLITETININISVSELNPYPFYSYRETILNIESTDESKELLRISDISVMNILALDVYKQKIENKETDMEKFVFEWKRDVIQRYRDYAYVLKHRGSNSVEEDMESALDLNTEILGIIMHSSDTVGLIIHDDFCPEINILIEKEKGE